MKDRFKGDANNKRSVYIETGIPRNTRSLIEEVKKGFRKKIYKEKSNMKYMSEIYYENLYYDVLKELSGGDDFLEEFLKECVFDEISNQDNNNSLSERLLMYKKELNEFIEGWQWPYTKKMEKDEGGGLLKIMVGREGRERLQKISSNVLKMLEDFEKFKNETIEKLKKRKKKGIAIGATLLTAIIIKKAYNMYQKHLYGGCVKLSGKERILCQMKMLEGYKEMLVKQMDNCIITSHPVKCQRKLKKAIEKIDEELIEFAEKLS